MNPLRALALSGLLAATALAGCSGGDAPDAAKESQTADVDAKPGIAVSDGRLVLPAVSGNPAAAYFTIANQSEKAATLAAVHIDGAAKAEMHQTSGGSMAPVDKVDLQSGAEVKFAPGGMHVMAFEPGDTLAAGGTAEMTLTFDGGDKISVPLAVEAAGGMAAGDDTGHSGH